MNFLIKNIFFILLLQSSFFMQGQEPVIISLLEKENLPDKDFYNIIEDDKGFIWLSASKGLFRYDGKVFKKFTHKDQKGVSIFGGHQDALGRIWVNNISGQFFYVKDEKLVLFTDLGKLLQGELTIFIVRKKHIWIFKERTIYKVNLETKVLETVQRSKDIIGIPFKYKNAILFSKNDSIHKITERGEIVSVLSTKQYVKDENGNKIAYGRSKFFKTNNDLLFRRKIDGAHRVFRVDLLGKKLDEITGFNAIKNLRIYNEFVVMGGRGVEDYRNLTYNNKVSFLTNLGSMFYDITGNKATLLKRYCENFHITKVLRDSEDNYWTATLNKGVFVAPNIFIESLKLSLEYQNITCMEKVKDSLLFFGSDNGKIVKYNLQNHQEEVINLPTNYRVSTLKYHPKKNSLFISTDENGALYNLATGNLQTLKHFISVKSAEVLSNDDLFFIDYARVTLLSRGDVKNKENHLSVGIRGYCSYYDTSNDNIYISLIDGLKVYDTSWNKKVITYKNKPINVRSITKTANGIIWVATLKQGLLGIKNNKVIKHYTVANKLKSNSNTRIKADQNNLWVVSEHAIQVIDVETDEIKTLTGSDGIISFDVSGIEMIKNKVYFSTNEGVFIIDKQSGFKNLHPEVYFNQFSINDKDTLLLKDYQLKHKQNTIKIGFNVNGYTYNKQGKYRYRLKGLNNQWFTTAVGETSVKYNSLPAGKYLFEVQTATKNKTGKNSIKKLKFTIKKPFWQTWWFIAFTAIFVVASIVFYYRKKIKEEEKERKKELEKISLEKELIAINLTALRSQMNPHFIFNALNSIQDLILKEDTEASYDYIVLFAQLIRNTLNYSNQDFIPVDEEIKFLSVYLQLEQLRFGKEFCYSVVGDAQEDIEIPSLLIQPFIENALVHGLMHKTGKKELDITFSLKKDVIECIIIDNGIGRKRASEISKRQGSHHKSFALNAIQKRLEIFEKQYGNKIGYTVHDLYEDNKATGTKVVVKIPYQNKF